PGKTATTGWRTTRRKPPTKAADGVRCGPSERNAGDCSSCGLLLPPQFVLQTLRQPLLHHRLVVEEARAGDALDAGKHPRVEAQRDGGGLAGIRLVDGAGHQAGVQLVVLPELGFGLLVFK